MAGCNQIKSLPAPRPTRKWQHRKNSLDSVRAVVRRLLLFVLAIAAAGSSCVLINAGQARFEDYLYAQISAPLEGITYVTPENKNKDGLELDARAIYSLRMSAMGRERTIIKKNTEESLPIASLTKLMTAVIALEHPEIYPPDKQVTIDAVSAGQDDVPLFGNLLTSETHTVANLLNLMLFYSSNDAAWVLAEIMGIDKFVVAMNQKAVDLGLENTKFYNPHGLDQNDGTVNRASADDLMALVKYILNIHPEIFSYSTQPGGPYLTENGIFNPKLWDGEKLIGGKTGYTQKAGGCLIMIFENEKKRRYINILLGSTSPETRVAEMQKLINFANNVDN